MHNRGTVVFMLTHTHVDPVLFAGRSDSVIGFFTSRQAAEVAQEGHARLPGFSDSPAGFKIHVIELDSLLTQPIEIWE